MSHFEVEFAHSGVINYINEFGELNDNPYKTNDPVSELYYAATRYFRGLNSPSNYYSRSNSVSLSELLDGFPVITDWYNRRAHSDITNRGEHSEFDDVDPIQYACQKNVLLGIGDTNTGTDTDLPGSNSFYLSSRKSINDDNEVDVSRLNGVVAQLQNRSKSGTGNNLNASQGFGWLGGTSPGYMVGLAFDSHTRDLRPDWPGKQTISTYWVDVLEYRQQKALSDNQFWLAAKYGGFEPVAGEVNGIDGINDIDPDNNYQAFLNVLPNDGLPMDWWYTNNQRLQPTNRFTGAINSEQDYERTDNYFPAGQANDMVSSLGSAFARIVESLTSTASALTSNTSRLESDTLIFNGIFYSGDWHGDLLASNTTAANSDSGSSTNIVGARVWSAADKLDKLENINSRRIYTTLLSEGNVNRSDPDGSLGSRGLDFTWANLNQQWKKLSNNTERNISNSQAEAELNYIRGDRSNENGDAGSSNRAYQFRSRGSRLGDIVNSTPAYSYRENFGYNQLSMFEDSNGNQPFLDAAETYADFQNRVKEGRTPIVAVGANDGMMHIFNATDDDDGGEELFAYVPADILPNLYQLTEEGYTHRYYVDGSPRIGDAYINGSWHTLAVATEGAGGSSVFALDITHPSATNDRKVLWEYHNTKMGRLIQSPELVALPNGKFGVIVSSGYDAPEAVNSHEAYIWILNAETGQVIREISIPTDGELGTPLAVDSNYDLVADRIYVADTAGQLWRIDLDSSSQQNWGLHVFDTGNGQRLAHGLLFTAQYPVAGGRPNPQPITAPLVATTSNSGYPMILFGTGAYYRQNDSQNMDTSVQSFYGIIDRNTTAVTSRDQLTQQRILEETTAGNYSARITSNNSLGGHRGWYMDLNVPTSEGGEGAVGERVVTAATFSGNEVLFTTLIPSPDPCASGGDSWIMGLEVNSGGRPAFGSFDYNNNGDPQDDTFGVPQPDGSTVSGYGSGFKSPVGVTPSIPVISSPNDSVPRRTYLCYHGSSDVGEVCIVYHNRETEGRQSWRELINDSGIDFTGNGTNGN